ncbi:hypothetical protein [Streptomyces sp. NPDC094032]|uniref:hypothetical protein n=1 Tax=Streptomyces sp. NPDC094032 TaxID=3155308 RepID=UPI003331E3E1
MIGTVIALLGLLVSVTTGFVAYRHGHRAERAEQERDEREEQDRRRREEQEERAERIRQASWISVSVEGDGRRVTVRNSSSQPVGDVRVLAEDEPLRPGGVRLLVSGAVAAFAPGSDGVDLDPARLAVEFTDVAGRVWRRTAEGRLHERLSPEGAPPHWGPPIAPLVEPYRGSGQESVGGDTDEGPVARHSETRRPTGPPTGPLDAVPPPPFPDASAPAGAGSGALPWRALFLLGCLGAAAALAYLIARIV